MTRSAEYIDIKSLMGTVPVSLEVMEDKGLLPVYFPILKNLFMEEDSGHIPTLIKKSIAAALSTRCSNTYCFLGHTMYLINNGISMEELPIILQQLQFPSRITDHEKWSKVLKWAYMFGDTSSGNSIATRDVDNIIGDILDEDEKTELFNLIMGNTILNRFSEFYAAEISWQNDVPAGQRGAQFQQLVPELVSFYHKVSSNPKEDRPVVNMCMYCKDIKDSAGEWQAFETTLKTLDKNSMFSHSICPCCYEKHHKVHEADEILVSNN